MAVSKIKCDEWYCDGEEIDLRGTWVALSGQGNPVIAGFTIPGKKRIPPGATFTLSNLHLNWLRGENVMLTPTMQGAAVSGDSVIVNVGASEGMSKLTFYCVHINDGYAVIHTS